MEWKRTVFSMTTHKAMTEVAVVAEVAHATAMEVEAPTRSYVCRRMNINLIPHRTDYTMTPSDIACVNLLFA